MIKRDCRDIKFSNLIRLAANWTCQRCFKFYPEGTREGLDCSHFFSRTKRVTRWHPWNAAAHCRGCHQHLGDNPIFFNRWIIEHLGKEKYEHLRVIQRQSVIWRKYELDQINKHLLLEYKRMVEIREAGGTEFYFFNIWYG